MTRSRADLMVKRPWVNTLVIGVLLRLPMSARVWLFDRDRFVSGLIWAMGLSYQEKRV